MNRKKYETWLGVGYEGLVNGIIKQAVMDYYSGIRALVANPHNLDAQKRSTDARRFMKSKWFASMTDIDGGWLLRKIEKDVAEETKGKSKKVLESVTN